MDQHCFAFYLTDSYGQIKRILKECGLSADADGLKLATPIRKWLTFKPADEAGMSLIIHGTQNKSIRQQLFLETCWGIGNTFLETLSKFFYHSK